MRRSLSAATARRFYKKTDIAAMEGGFGIRLDGRPLKSPARAPLVLPSRPLALAIAAEWDAQTEFIEPAAMPLFSLAATTVDQVVIDRATVERNVLAYAKTDTTCFLAGEAEEPRLHQLQLSHFMPLLEWVRTHIGANLEPGYGIFHRNAEDLSALKSWLAKLSAWELAALQCATQECKSIVIGLALIHRHIDIIEAEKAARLEESVQIDRWGFVEGSHDYDVTRIRFRLASASLFADLSL